MKRALEFLSKVLLLFSFSCSSNEPDLETWLNNNSKWISDNLPKYQTPPINYDSLWLRCEAQTSTTIEYDFGLKEWWLVSTDTVSSARGICWSTKPGPTVLDNKITINWGSFAYVVDYLIEGLDPATSYYIRGYFTKKNGVTSYSPELLVTTLYVTTITPYEITASSALSGGMDSYLGPDVIERGVSFSSATCERMPPSTFTKTSDKIDTVAYSCLYTSLNPGESACATAYIITADKIIHFGNNINFTLKRR
jgi:hypothetical protein